MKSSTFAYIIMTTAVSVTFIFGHLSFPLISYLRFKQKARLNIPTIVSSKYFRVYHYVKCGTDDFFEIVGRDLDTQHSGSKLLKAERPPSSRFD